MVEIFYTMAFPIALCFGIFVSAVFSALRYDDYHEKMVKDLDALDKILNTKQ